MRFEIIFRIWFLCSGDNKQRDRANERFNWPQVFIWNACSRSNFMSSRKQTKHTSCSFHILLSFQSFRVVWACMFAIDAYFTVIFHMIIFSASCLLPWCDRMRTVFVDYLIECDLWINIKPTAIAIIYWIGHTSKRDEQNDDIIHKSTINGLVFRHFSSCKWKR